MQLYMSIRPNAPGTGIGALAMLGLLFCRSLESYRLGRQPRLEQVTAGEAPLAILSSSTSSDSKDGRSLRRTMLGHRMAHVRVLVNFMKTADATHSGGRDKARSRVVPFLAFTSVADGWRRPVFMEVHQDRTMRIDGQHGAPQRLPFL